jgi:hypothetical protein
MKAVNATDTIIKLKIGGKGGDGKDAISPIGKRY